MSLAMAAVRPIACGIGDIVALVEATDAKPGERGPYKKKAA